MNKPFIHFCVYTLCMKFVLLATGIYCITFLQSGCTYDKAELLNPGNTCDTTNISYSFSIVPLLTSNCTGCHSGASAPNGVRLDTYEGVNSVADALLLGVINQSRGYIPMPKNGTKLTDCSINKITQWLAAGRPHN